MSLPAPSLLPSPSHPPQASAQSASDLEALSLRAIADAPVQDGLIRVQDATFPKLVLGKHRPYHAFVLFTTANHRGECHACE